MGKANVTYKKGEKKFEVMIPKYYGNKGEDAMYVSVNDESIRIKYGEKVEIPARFKEVIETALKERAFEDAFIEEKKSK